MLKYRAAMQERHGADFANVVLPKSNHEDAKEEHQLLASAEDMIKSLGSAMFAHDAEDTKKAESSLKSKATDTKKAESSLKSKAADTKKAESSTESKAEAVSKSGSRDEAKSEEQQQPTLPKKRRAGAEGSESSFVENILDEPQDLKSGEEPKSEKQPTLPKKRRAGKAGSESSLVDIESPQDMIADAEAFVAGKIDPSEPFVVSKKNRAGKGSSESSFAELEDLKSAVEDSPPEMDQASTLSSVAPKKDRHGKGSSESSLIEEEALQSTGEESATENTAKMVSLPTVAPNKNRHGKASSESSDEDMIADAEAFVAGKIEPSEPFVVSRKNRPGQGSSESSFVELEDLKSANEESRPKMDQASTLSNVAPTKARPGMQGSDSTWVDQEDLKKKTTPQLEKDQDFKPVPTAGQMQSEVVDQTGGSLMEVSGKKTAKKVTRSKKSRAGSNEEIWEPTAENSESSTSSTQVTESQQGSLAETDQNAKFDAAWEDPHMHIYTGAELPDLRARRKFCPNPVISAQYKTEVLNCQMDDFFGIESEQHKYSEAVMEKDALEIENFKRILHAQIRVDDKNRLLDGQAPPTEWTDPHMGFDAPVHIYPGDGYNDDLERTRQGADLTTEGRYPDPDPNSPWSRHWKARVKWEKQQLGLLPMEVAQAVETSSEVSNLAIHAPEADPWEADDLYPAPVIDGRARQYVFPAAEADARKYRKVIRANIQEFFPGWGTGWFLQKHNGHTFKEGSPDAQTLAQLGSDESTESTDASEGPEAMDSEDMATLKDLIEVELLSRGGEDVDIGYAKLAAKRSRSRKHGLGDDFTAVEIGVLVGVIVLLVILLVALTKKASKNEPRYKQGSMTLDSSDLESSETGSTDRELKLRMERFEQRLEEHTRMLEAEEQGSSRGSEDLDPSSSSKRPNWMTKK
jgi:hypothetical protein